MPDWTEQNLLDLIANQQEEHVELDFKRAAALAKADREKSEISKDVSAFANTIGGTILYGVQEAPDPPHAATALDPIDPNTITKEWLEQVINSRIHRRISGISIDPIQLPTTRAGYVVYRVVIPESDTVHQAYDKKYYKRFNFESIPMEDHEIRQAMFRLTKPSYEIVPRVRTAPVAGGIEIFFTVTVLNTSEITGHDCSLLAYLPNEVVPRGPAYERVEVLGIDCVRMRGHRGVDLPPGPVDLEITRGLIVPDGQHNLDQPIPIFFRIYDSHGLALFERFSFVRSTREVVQQESIEVGRRRATILP